MTKATTMSSPNPAETPPLDCPQEELIEFIRSLKPGDRVVERGQSCMTGETGTVVLCGDGRTGVRWDTKFREGSGMVTSVTGGTRRLQDI